MAVNKLIYLLTASIPCLCTSAVLAEPIGEDRLQPGLYPSAPITEDGLSSDAPFDIDWSMGLRGTKLISNQGESFSVRLRPEVDIRSNGALVQSQVRGSAELTRGDDNQLTFTSANLSANARVDLSDDLRLSSEAGVKFTRELANTPGHDPLILQPADVTQANLMVSADQKLGRFNLGLRGSLDRTVYGDTNRRDTGWTSNSGQNNWQADTRLRVGYQVSPIFEIYGEGALGRYWFDHANLATGASADANTRSVKLGVSGNWQDVVSAHAAVGLGQYSYVDGSQGDITTRIYEAGLRLNPDPTTSVAGTITTTIEPTGADNSGTARVVNTARLDADHTLNSYMHLRASAEVSHSQVEGSGEVEDRRALGLGTDYALGNKTKLNADYNYAHRTNSATGTFESHQLSVGVTLKR